MNAETIPYAVAVCNIIDRDARVFYGYQSTPQEALIEAVKAYAIETDGTLNNYRDWISEVSPTATIQEIINHFLQGDLAISEPLRILE